MDKQALTQTVESAYKKRYPTWRGVEVTELVEDAFGGNIAAVRTTDEVGAAGEEICFASNDGTVTIFYTTEELVRFLQQKAHTPALERFFTRPVMSGFICLVLLVVLTAFATIQGVSQQIVTIFGNAFGLAVGFFFGSAAKT